MARAYLALGSNLGDRAATLRAALAELGIPDEHVSSFHETAPEGGPPDAGPFLNAAAVLDTSLTPEELLHQLLAVERKQGRVRHQKNDPRTLDIDLLLYDDLVRSGPDPMVPHPRMHEREFVLAPLAEVASDVVHPALKFTVRELLAQVRGHAPSAFRLDGVRAMVTGATSGIGRAIALLLAAQGADVIVHGRDVKRAATVVADIGSLGRRSETLLADLSEIPACERLSANAWRQWNGIDVWVNNAGADTLTGSAGRLSFDDKLQTLWDVDVRATVCLSRLVGEKMHARGRGCIINIGWDQAETGMDGDSGQLFGTIKSAVMAFTKSLAKSLAPAVRVNCVAPGWIKTAWGESASDDWQQRVLRETPMNRWGTPNDVAGAVAWLASPAAEFITGQIIRVNGGVVM